MARDLKLKPDQEPVCGICSGVGLVVRDGAFRRCVCPRGALAGVEQWHGHAIDPRDMDVRIEVREQRERSEQWRVQ